MLNNKKRIMLKYRWKTTGLSYFKIIFDQVVILIKLKNFSRVTLIRIMVFFQLSSKMAKMTGYNLI
jgi:hypothetical protein